ncbi:MAG TPA: bifunctional serine/threonine protein kinase/MFS transporter, partial [Ktedonobacteraceae bacterium]|nr:bifunctional serine/threonine protein kinase/MFS transporter [Ktedonobacteraceae bacterium]
MRTIGHGGMAAVYQARDTRAKDARQGNLCAIKEMSLSTVQENEKAQAIQNFLAEARILSRLNHPNLPAFTDFFTEGARHFLVMEYVDGSTLEDLLEQNGGPFSERRVLGWGRQLCDVLEYLHGQQPPVIFRDMKPGNIMLTRSGRIKLIDFGIARLFRATSAQDTQLLGTPGFAPPEQYGSAQTDERSDIYSLAMTLYQLMTYEMPESGFGLSDVHLKHPQISPPVARALEKATALRPEDRYESIVVFRRALLGVGTFRFETGSEATTPEELAELCAHFPDEAADYLYNGEIESWLQEIGSTELARNARRIRSTIGDPDMAVNRFLQAVMGPSAHTRTQQNMQAVDDSQTIVTGTKSRITIPGTRSSRAGRMREPGSDIIVRPKIIDFGQVYPGLSAPMLLTIAGAKGALVSGTIHPVESWIITDSGDFDGMSTPVRVRVDTSRLRGSTHYTGTIIVEPGGSELEIPVSVEVDVLGYATNTTSVRSRGAQTQGTPVDEDDDALNATVVTGRSAMKMAPQATVQNNSSYASARDSEYKTKYGLPGSGGWEPLKASKRQRTWIDYSYTFAASFMTVAFFYLFLAHLPPLAHISFLPPSSWFLAILLGLVPLTTLGAMIASWNRAWSGRETLNRVCTGLAVAMLVLGLGEGAWQGLTFPTAPSLQLFIMLLITAIGATVGTAPRICARIFKSVIWVVRRMRRVALAITIVLGAALGFALTNNFAYGLFSLLPIALGIGIAFLLVRR